MPFLVIQNDITKMNVDAIVNAANSSLLGGGGVDGAIHAAAGPELLRECMTLNGCFTGEAKLTQGYRLPAKYVIHTVGPVWRGGDNHEEALLRKAYRSSLSIAGEKGFASVAFPLISGGAYGYPKKDALRIAEEELSAFSSQHDDVTLYLVLFSKNDLVLSEELRSGLDRFLARFDYGSSDAPFGMVSEPAPLSWREMQALKQGSPRYSMELESQPSSAFSEKKRKQKNGKSADALCLQEAAPEDFIKPLPYAGASGNPDLNLDESFQHTLFRLIDAKGLSDPDCYHRANIDRRLFSKIRSNGQYKPSKQTACALAIALRLTLPETQDFLLKAGFILSNSLMFDKIIMFCLERQIYDYIRVNELLLQYDQPLLGS